MGRRIFVTGCSGYLAQRLMEACREDPDVEWLGGIDVRPPATDHNFLCFQMDIRSPELANLLVQHRIDTVVHLAWVFNPTHRQELEYEVDVVGSKNVLNCIEKTGTPYLIYLSSTTAYGPHPDNPEIFDEECPRRGHEGYLYAKYKAEVDHLMLEFRAKHPEIRMLILRPCIILGPNTRNIVTRMTEMPLMIGVRGYNPPMQFLHEKDLQNVLTWAVKNQPEGIYNIVGKDTIRYNDLVKKLKKRMIALPAGLAYPIFGLLWRLRLMPFPPSMLDFIRYPWVASGQRFEKQFGLSMVHTSEEALLAYARARWPEKFHN